ncbi:MAG: hypothetical protein ACE5LU_01385 [Anaerolineae bacterium]
MIVATGLLAIRPGTQPAMAQMCQQLVRNPEFEAGTADWETQSAAGSEIIVPEAAFHGAYGARLAGTNHADDRLWQWISFPETPSSVSLTFAYRVETNDSRDPPTDHFWVQLLDEQGRVLINLVQLHNGNVRGQWFRRVRFLDPAEVEILAGRSAQFQFRATTDQTAPTRFLIDDINLQVCTSARPAVSELRMSPSVHGPSRDHFLDELDEVFISFAYHNVGQGDNIRLLIRDLNGTPMLDHTFSNLAGSGTRQAIFTGRDAVDGLVRSGLEAGNSVVRHSERALQAGSRFRMAPYLERAIVAVTVLQNATRTLRTFQVGEEANAYLAQAQVHIDAALAAGETALDPANDLDQTKALVAAMRDEAQVALLKVAETRSAVHSDSLAFPDTIDCQFNLTNVYLNQAPVDSIEWTVGAPGPPARVHPPQDTRRSGALHVQPLTIYTQEVTSAEAPHMATITGRITDAHCRPVADGTHVTFALDNPSLGSLVPETGTTSEGYFTTALWATDVLGDGAVTVRARAGVAEGVGVVFLVGPPAAIDMDTATSTVHPGHSMEVVIHVRDTRGQAVADGTNVSFRVSPPDAGNMMPDRTTTSGGFASASFVAGDELGYVTIHAAAGDVENVAVVEIARQVSTATPTPTFTPTATPTTLPTPTPSPTATLACDSGDAEQMCNGIVSVRVFEDARCDGHFNRGMDRALLGVSVSLIYPDGTSVLNTTDPNGYAHFGGIHLRGDERVALLVGYPEDMVTSGLTPCDNSGTLRFLDRDDFGSFGTASVMFRAHRQIVVRRGILHVAEASLCFTARYYLDPTDGGPVVYLVTDQDLSEHLDREVEVTGSTWEIEFCRYLLPLSIIPVP